MGDSFNWDSIAQRTPGAYTTALTIAEKFPENIKDKTILITGVTPGGIGAEAALTLAAFSPRLLVLAGRSLSKGQLTATAIAEKHPTTKTRLLELDLASFAAVEKAATEVLSWDVPIDILINNAAVMGCPFAKTGDGVEMQMQTNHLGPFLFTNLIMPAVLRSEGRRVVNVASEGYAYSDVAMAYWDHNFMEGVTYHKKVAYGRSKTANILFTVALAKRLAKKGVVTIAPHPGGLMTNLLRHHGEDEDIPELSNIPNFRFKTLQEGAASYFVAALDPAMEEHNGAFIRDCEVSKPHYSYADDPENAEKCWAWSEKMVGKKFDY